MTIFIIWMILGGLIAILGGLTYGNYLKPRLQKDVVTIFCIQTTGVLMIVVVAGIITDFSPLARLTYPLSLYILFWLSILTGRNLLRF